MLTVEKIDTQNKSQVRRFVRLPYRLYAQCPQWVPPLFVDEELRLDRRRHPFYEHSDADFFIAVRGGRDVGRIAALENRRFNQYHDTRQGQFYLFECEDDSATANALFARVCEWAHARGLNRLVGPKGFGALDSYGLLIEGFEHRQLMMLMGYHLPYYQQLVTENHFQKDVDFVSCYVSSATFQLPDRVRHIAERAAARSGLQVVPFKSKNDLKRWANRIGQAYNRAFVNNWEYYPLTEREIKSITDNLMMIGDPRLIKVMTHQDQVVGFLFAFPDLSAALQRARGKLLPFGIFDLMREMNRTDWVAVYAAGILPEFQGRGGNALLYFEIEKTIRQTRFRHADLAQVAETATQMRQDLVNLGAQPYKNHRVFWRAV
jgi:hypothetical protein